MPCSSELLCDGFYFICEDVNNMTLYVHVNGLQLATFEGAYNIMLIRDRFFA